MPAATFFAPHTICTGASSPISTLHTLSLSASGCCSRVSTLPTTTPSNAAAAGSTASTSRPAMLNWSASSRVLTAGSTHSRNQASLNLMFLSRSKLTAHCVAPVPPGAWLHPAAGRQANCLRKRRSFSKKRRRSLTP